MHTGLDSEMKRSYRVFQKDGVEYRLYWFSVKGVYFFYGELVYCFFLLHWSTIGFVRYIREVLEWRLC